MRKIEPFSKELCHGDTVSNDEGQRSGFTEHVKITKVPAPEMKGVVKGMDWTHTESRKYQPNESYPDFRSKSDDGLPAFPPAFSKKTISGGPKKPTTPA